MNNSERFIDKYNELENTVRSVYDIDNNESISEYLEKGKFRAFKSEIKYCREVRNLLQHKTKIDNQYSVIPSEQMILFIEKLITRVRDKSRCFDIAVKSNEIYCCRLDDCVKEAMIVMNEKRYSHVPIVDEGKLIGIFDENVLFNMLAKEEIVGIDNMTKFLHIKEYLNIDGRETVDFLFIDSNEYVDKLVKEFEKRFKKDRRIGLVFLTLGGKPQGKIIGIITASDIISNISRQGFFDY